MSPRLREESGAVFQSNIKQLLFEKSARDRRTYTLAWLGRMMGMSRQEASELASWRGLKRLTAIQTAKLCYILDVPLAQYNRLFALVVDDPEDLFDTRQLRAIREGTELDEDEDEEEAVPAPVG